MAAAARLRPFSVHPSPKRRSPPASPAAVNLIGQAHSIKLQLDRGLAGEMELSYTVQGRLTTNAELGNLMPKMSAAQQLALAGQLLAQFANHDR